MPTLEVFTESQGRQFYEITGDEILVGRDPFCDVVLKSHTVSRQHARIVRTPEGYFIEDLDSLNGTFVNHQRVAGRVSIKDQDRIHIYETALIFYSGAPNEAAEHEEVAGVVAESAADEEHGNRRTTFIKSIDPTAAEIDRASQAKFRAALKISRSLENIVDLDEMLVKLLDSLFSIFPQAARGYVLLAEPPDGHLVPRAIKLSQSESGHSMTFGPISRKTASRVMTEGEAILMNDHAPIAEAGQSIFDFEILSLICAPLMGPSHSPLGIIYIDETDPAQLFTQEDLDVLVTVATIAGQEVEIAFGETTTIQPARPKSEWGAAAKQMQMQFLPQHRPEIEGYQFFDYYQAAHEVGGDYFGYIPLSDGRLALAIGDVAGKGVSAALLMAHFAAEVRYCVTTSATPAEAVSRLNQDLGVESPNPRFVTFALGILDPQTHTLSVVNAGHLPPLRRRGSRTVEELGAAESGLPLGCDLERGYRQVDVLLEPGDTVLLYTDGITEAMDVSGETFGMATLRQAVAKAPNQVERLCLAVLNDIQRFAHGGQQSDDICMVCLGRKASS